MKKAYLFIGVLVFLSTLMLPLSSCNPFKPQEKPRHICSFDTETVVTRQDCDSDGIIVRSCICGQQRTEILSAPGHSFGGWETQKTAGCTTLGYESRTCDKCKKTETRIIENTGHDYQVSEEKIDGTPYNRYTCFACGDSFLLQSGVTMPDASQEQLFLANREKDFSFQIISIESEEYIREHLKIVNAYFDDDNHSVDYSLTEAGGGCWIVSPATEYDGGSSYVAKRSGGVIFSQCGFSNLAFSIKSEERHSVALSDEIIYVAALDEANGGYYPYNLDFSERSGEYFLTLESAGELKVGDLICVGDAKDAEEYLAGGSNTFGIIEYITTLNDGRTLLMLSVPSLHQVFDSLKVYTENITELEKVNDSEDLPDQLTSALYSDPDFIGLISATYLTAEEHLTSRGLTAKASFEEFVESIELSKDESVEPTLKYSPNGNFIYAKTAIRGEGSIPVMSEDVEIGIIKIEFSASVSINSISMKVWIEKGKFGPSHPDDLEFSFEVREDVGFAFSFDIATFIDHSFDEELFRLDLTDGIYHYRGCAELASKENQSSIRVFEILSLMQLGQKINECRLCHPITDIAETTYVLDVQEKVYHTSGCDKLDDISQKDLLLTERDADILSEEGFDPCPTCHPESIPGCGFETRLGNRIARGDYDEYRDEFVQITGILERSNTEINLGEYIASLGGIDEERITLSAYFDFHINASMHYEYESGQSFFVGYRNTENGAMHYLETTKAV